MKNSKSKIILGVATAALLFTSTIKVNAQTEVAAHKVGEFGFRFMPTFSKFNMKTASGGVVKGQATLGYGAGVFLGINFSKHIGVQAELMYSAINQKYTDKEVERKIDLKYINIPLLISLNTGKTKPVNFNVVAGPQIGINVGSKVEGSGTNGTDTVSAVLSIKQGDVGLAYGFGIDFGLNTKQTFRLGLGYRGVYGLLDISDKSKSTTTDQYYIVDKTNLVTNSFYASLSLLF